jgi:RNA polymerase sigma-70 factor, ECF subfamily
MSDPLRDIALQASRVYAYVAYRIGPGPDAEDVTSMTFERALRYRHTFDSRRGNATAWLIGIARRCIAEAAMQPVPTRVEGQPEAVGPDTTADVPERLDLASAVARLTDRERELIALRYGSDLTARQIAEVLEMTTNAVEVALHRALKSLRAVLDAEQPPFEEAK